MSKLPVISGADCVKALGKIGFEVYRQRGSHIVIVRNHRPAKQPFLITRSSIAAPSARSSARQASNIEEFIALL